MRSLALLSFLVIASPALASSCEVSGDGGWSKVWRHCFACAAQRMLQGRVLEGRSPFAAHRAVGVDYGNFSGVYTVDLQGPGGDVARMTFFGSGASSSGSYTCRITPPEKIRFDTAAVLVVNRDTGALIWVDYGTKSRF